MLKYKIWGVPDSLLIGIISISEEIAASTLIVCVVPWNGGTMLLQLITASHIDMITECSGCAQACPNVKIPFHQQVHLLLNTVAHFMALSTHTTIWNTCCHNTAKLITMYFYWLILQKRNFSQAQCELPDDGPGGPKHVGANIRYFYVNFNILYV
jgi:hypothetical protein